ncbi:MAG TPA: type II secretion system F family protein [Thermoplasmata archaeon]|nr:type II secretion system F family protein [Thermoplasmata archaeon]
MYPAADATRETTGAEPTAPAAPKTLPASERVVSRYRVFCYHLLGERLDRGEPDEILADRLKQAGINASPGMHRSVEILTTVFAVLGALAAGLVLFLFFLRIPDWYAYLALEVGVVFAAVLGGFRFLLSTRIANRKDRLDRELPFTLSELSVLASTGTSPIRLMRRMAQRDHDPAMTAEFKKIVYKTDVQGKDLITALAETAKESPSTSLREALWDLANMIHQGGNLDEYLRTKSDDVMKLKRLIQKEFIERLSTFLDMYVSLVLVGVLMIAVGAFLLNALGSTAAGLDANELLLLLTFGLVPVAVVMTIVLISIAYSKAE